MSFASGADTAVDIAVKASQAACIYASCWPINLLTARTMGKGIGGPFTIATAANGWFQTADHLEQAASRLEELSSGLSADQWTGDDRTAFDTEVSELALQIRDAKQFAQIVAWTLTGEAIPLAEWPVGCGTIGTIQAINASAFYAAVASIVGNLGPSEVIYAEGLAVAFTCNRALKAGSWVVRGLLLAGAATVAGGAVDNANDQREHGDEDARGDLVKATIKLPGWIDEIVKGGDGDTGPFSGAEPTGPPPGSRNDSDRDSDYERGYDRGYERGREDATDDAPGGPGPGPGGPGPGPGGPGPGPGGPGPGGPGPGPADDKLEQGGLQPDGTDPKDQDKGEDKGEDKDKGGDDSGQNDDGGKGDDGKNDGGKDDRGPRDQLDLAEDQLRITEGQIPADNAAAREQVQAARQQIEAAQRLAAAGNPAAAVEQLNQARQQLDLARDQLTGPANADARQQLDAAKEQIEAAQKSITESGEPAELPDYPLPPSTTDVRSING